jgi:hypothetical protein
MRTFHAAPRPGRRLCLRNVNHIGRSAKASLRVRLDAYRGDAVICTDRDFEKRLLRSFFEANGLADPDEHTAEAIERRAVLASDNLGASASCVYPRDIIAEENAAEREYARARSRYMH